MNNSSTTGDREEATAGMKTECLCGGMGAAVSQMMRMMGPQGEAADHFRQARIEALKGLRAILDQRIDALASGGASKGTKVNVE